MGYTFLDRSVCVFLRFSSVAIISHSSLRWLIRLQNLCLAYLDDLFGPRLWCNDEAASIFVENIETAFPAAAPAANLITGPAVPGRFAALRGDTGPSQVATGGLKAPERRVVEPGAARSQPLQRRYSVQETEQLRVSFFQRFHRLFQGGLQKETSAKMEAIFSVAARCGATRDLHLDTTQRLSCHPSMPRASCVGVLARWYLLVRVTVLNACDPIRLHIHTHAHAVLCMYV